MTETAHLRVLDFDCPTCASTVERALGSAEGVAGVEVHYTTGRIEVTYDEHVTGPDDFVAAVENHGYTPQRA